MKLFVSEQALRRVFPGWHVPYVEWHLARGGVDAEGFISLPQVGTNVHINKLSDGDVLAATSHLSDEDREALRWLVKHVNATTMPGVRPRAVKERALAVLERLIRGT